MKKYLLLPTVVFILTVSLNQTCAQTGEALNFDGVNDNVSLTHFARFQNMTLEAMIKTNSSATMQLIGWAGTTGNSAEFKLSNGLIGYFEWDGSTFPGVGGYQVNDNIWHHVAMVRDSSTMNNVSIYVDGILVAAGTVNHPITTNKLNIGAYNYFGMQQFYEGDLDEVRIWNRALTQAEILNNINCELAQDQIGLVRYFKFNQGTSGSNNSGLTTLVDSSENNNNGILNSFALNGATSNWIAPGGVISGTICNAFVGIDEMGKNSNTISSYPNPFTTQTVLQAVNSFNNVTLTVYNCFGQIVKQIKNISGKTVTLSRDNLASGMYIVQLTEGNKIIAVNKLVITDQ